MSLTDQAGSGPMSLRSREGLPDALRLLVDEIPRPTWEAHPNFGGMVQFWLQRHMMFRRLLDVLEADLQRLRTASLALKPTRPACRAMAGSC